MNKSWPSAAPYLINDYKTRQIIIAFRHLPLFRCCRALPTTGGRSSMEIVKSLVALHWMSFNLEISLASNDSTVTLRRRMLWKRATLAARKGGRHFELDLAAITKPSSSWLKVSCFQRHVPLWNNIADAWLVNCKAIEPTIRPSELIHWNAAGGKRGKYFLFRR